VLETRNDFPGNAEGPLDRVFDRFYRLDADNMSKYEGNGVGLSIVKEIVDAHRGRAKAKGEGGDFVLKIEF
jgi:signal transduction histidine kinase